MVYYTQQNLKQISIDGFMENCTQDEKKRYSNDMEELIHIFPDADSFRQGSCQLFARALQKRFGYDIYYISDGRSCHYFCKSEDESTYVDVRGCTKDYPYLNFVYVLMKSDKLGKWKQQQDEFWKTKPRADTTKEFFDVLATGGWKCGACEMPRNPNPQRRIQDLKEFGYTIATSLSRYCPHCGRNTSQRILLPIPRGASEGNGYETWSPALRQRIIDVLGSIDVYENTYNRNCLPDHKFSEIRWDADTKAENPDTMTDAEIRQKFQLLTNQRNQQKREMCRNCFQTGKRGYPFGIKYYYVGTEDWDSSIPTKGKQAECGCVGCGWYDFAAWRNALNKKLEEVDE